MILANSQAPPALIFAATALFKLFTGSWSRTADQQKDDTRKFLLNYLYNNGPALLQSSPTLLQNLVRLLCRIIKLGWLENLSYQSITEQVAQFLQASTPHFVVGLSIYTLLTEDMQPQGGTRLARFRRTAISFRETTLTEIFQTSIQTLQQLHSNAMPFDTPTEEKLLLKQVLQLALNCLSFDFTGSMTDESSDEQATVMIPHTWHILRQEKIPAMFFSLYHKSWTNIPPRPECARLCLQCLVLIAAVRRSFFQKEEERRIHMTQLIEGTASIIETGIGLQDDLSYHELCRLLGKINAAHQLSELSQSPGFQIWLDNVFQFTLRSLENWAHLPNSKHYLVWVWGNLVAPLLFLRDKAPANLSAYIRKVSIAFIDSRLRIAEAIARAAEEGDDFDFEDPLANEVMRAEQLEVVASLARCGYNETCRHTIKLLEEAHAAALANQISAAMFQQKATWLIYLIATLMNVQAEQRAGITTLLATDSASPFVPDSMDENDDETARPQRITDELASIGFRLIRETDKLATTPEGLELAYLYFLEQFRKVFISEHAKQLMQLQASETVLSVLGNTDPDSVLTLVVEKLFFNLQARIASEAVIRRTTQIFSDSVTGLSVIHAPTRMPQFIVTGRLLLRSALIQETLNDHQNPRFAFLAVPRYGQYRTVYYATLAKLLLLDMKEDMDERRWNSFMEPFANSFQDLRRSDAEGHFETSVNHDKVIGLARDLRGIASAVISVEAYSMLFNWLVDMPSYPGASRIDSLIRAADVWWADHTVMTPLLKFMVEFGWNKSERIRFEANSPNGIFLFKVISKLLQAYGQRILTRTTFQDIYREKYKGLACSLEMAAHALSGGYTNFGVFKVYNDTVLRDVLALCLQMCLVIPDEDLQAYIKTLKSYYLFLDLATSNFMELVMTLEPPSLAQLLRSLEEGLCSYESGVAMQSCGTIASVVQYMFAKKDDMTSPEGAAVRRFLTEQSQALRRILHLMLQLLATAEVASVWSMAPPLLGLILLHEEAFVQMKEQMIMQQIPERRATLKGYFDDLMMGIEDNLSAKNKENFAKNLYVFGQLMRSSFA